MREIKWLTLATYGIFYVLLSAKLPDPFGILIAAGILWKFLSIHRSLSAPPRVLLLSFASLAVLYLFLSAPSTWHHPTWSAALLVISLLWLCDRPHPMQIMMVHLTFFALLVTLLLLPGQSFPLPLYFFLTCMIFASLMYQHIDQLSQVSLFPLLQAIARTAIPAAVILLPVYFFFPELRPTPQDASMSGLSFSLEPGRYASLAESQRIAFRAYFPNGWAPQDPSHFYWRMGVLEESFGMTWKRKPDESPWLHWAQITPAEGISYELLTEDRLGKNLPHLEAFQGTNLQRNDIELRWNPEVHLLQGEAALMRLVAGPSSRYKPKQTPTAEDDKIQTSARVHELATQLRTLSFEDKLQFMRRELARFEYTLRPGKLENEDTLDQFWFEKRAGYCEHFAASFASIMRLAGVPARIVIGFQGGSILEDQKFLLLRDRDAHAWTELWDGQNWVRVDPTTMVPGSYREPLASGWSLYLFSYVSYLTRSFQDWLTRVWPDSDGLNLIIFLSLGIILFALIRKLLKANPKRPPWDRELKALLKQGARLGCLRSPTEPLGTYFKRLAHNFPHLQESIDEFIPNLNLCLYGDQNLTPEAIKALRAQLSTLILALKETKDPSLHKQ